MKFRASVLLPAALLLLSHSMAFGAQGPVITIDEYGQGDVDGRGIPSFFGIDPNPAHAPGQNGVLIYSSLPFAGTTGDLNVLVGPNPGAVIRFNGDRTIVVYALPGVGVNGNAPATQYKPSIPPFPVQNTATATFNGSILIYQPVPSQPGGDPSGPTYVIQFSSSPSPTFVLNPVSSNLKDSYQVTYSSSLDLADDVINVANAGSSAASLPPISGSSNVNNICVNAYVYQADSRLLSCCSCPIPANGLSSWPVVFGPRALLTNAARKPSSVVIKLVATSPIISDTQTPICDVTFQSAPFALVPGMAAFSTHAHPSNGTSVSLTEASFSEQSLSFGEASKLKSDCLALGSGGQCPACQAGGLAEPALKPTL